MFLYVLLFLDFQHFVNNLIIFTHQQVVYKLNKYIKYKSKEKGITQLTK